MEKRLFSELGLSQPLLDAVARMGFEEASPIQSAAIPVVLAGQDLVGQSATGSGKTAAFAIPAIEKIDLAVRAVQCLVLCPTRELAVQVAEEVGKLAFFKRGVHAVPIYGGQSY
ncbi:MAG: DEAD/DEAH box helicase, partial [Verrucomicrobia bacterium]|nr:DEAD/DEAH box helicase [Verrucomicrobiota bacterium]